MGAANASQQRSHWLDLICEMLGTFPLVPRQFLNAVSVRLDANLNEVPNCGWHPVLENIDDTCIETSDFQSAAHTAFDVEICMHSKLDNWNSRTLTQTGFYSVFISELARLYNSNALFDLHPLSKNRKFDFISITTRP